MTEAALLTFAASFSLALGTLTLFVGAVQHRKAVRVSCAALSAPLLLVGGVLFWYTHRPLPPSVNESLFQGIDYIREVRRAPRPLVIHIVYIDLDTSGLRFFVTPGGENIPARTVSQFADEFDLQLAINGDFFDPWRDYFPRDYYPHVGDPVNARGIAASEGVVFTNGYAPLHNTLYISADNIVTFDAPHGEIYNAISGNQLLVANGIEQIPMGVSSYADGLHPRTAVGLDFDGRTLILLLVDGRQPGYSEGVSLLELTELLLENGAYHAINMDGGGSTTLVRENADGSVELLNSPIHNRIPGRERPIANQLGVYALP